MRRLGGLHACASGLVAEHAVELGDPADMSVELGHDGADAGGDDGLEFPKRLGARRVQPEEGKLPVDIEYGTGHETSRARVRVGLRSRCSGAGAADAISSVKVTIVAAAKRR
ncbi:hypothetical protein FRZ61_35910 [Hypericibacter adhaerens]|uniref:Uncharacterized protein n=1 Tax=Hypericibacter adhaerens TaxID=2602016 RepID=A0A5J6N0Y6_9PROT|nr:hypothetical protein FRZ61_35910 [Hypericibacter adhaerens]